MMEDGAWPLSEFMIEQIKQSDGAESDSSDVEVEVCRVNAVYQMRVSPPHCV